MKRNWVNLLHIYQPPWQTMDVLDRIINTSYSYILNSLEKENRIKISLNVSGSLVEHLVREKRFDLIERIRALVNKGQIELVATAMYHPLLPLIPIKEVIRQIKLNEEFNSRYFKEEWLMAGSRYGGRGFYLPEIAYSNEVAKVISDLGYAWITIDETAIVNKDQLDWNKSYVVKGTKLKLLIRNRRLHPISKLSLHSGPENYLVTVTDGEIYGDHPNENLWWSIRWNEVSPELMTAEDNDFNSLTVGEYLNEISGPSQELDLKSSNWEMTKAEEEKLSYFHMWHNPDDNLHSQLWTFLKEIITVLEEHKHDKNFPQVREYMDKALSSCTWWWVDGRYLGYNPTEISKGLTAMITTARSFDHIAVEHRIRFEKLYSEIIYEVWTRHWKAWESKNIIKND